MCKYSVKRVMYRQRYGLKDGSDGWIRSRLQVVSHGLGMLWLLIFLTIADLLPRGREYPCSRLWDP